MDKIINEKSRVKIGVAIAALLLAVIFGHSFFLKNAAAGAADNIAGYAWSENIGWISFNCTNDASCGVSNYGVTADATGKLSGYAWSENIGWISFNSTDTVGCPQTPCAAKINNGLGQLNGWAKALAGGSGGWDGWIHLSGSNYGVTLSGCTYDGYAWGSDVVGWIHFKGTNYGVTGTGNGCNIILSADIKANGSDGPISIPYNTSATISWTSQNADSCSVSPVGWTGTSGSQPTGPLTSSQTYTLTCSKSGYGSISDTVTVNVFIPPLTASCSASPSSVKGGETVTWSATASGGLGTYSFSWHGDPPLEGKTGTPIYISYDTVGTKSGSVTVTSGAQTINAACSNTVNVTPGITSFTASPSKISIGEPSTLSWSSIGFNSCSIDQGIGGVPLSGQKIVTPNVTTTYTLTCIGGGPLDSRSVTVTVLEIPEFIEVVPKK